MTENMRCSKVERCEDSAKVTMRRCRNYFTSFAGLRGAYAVRLHLEIINSLVILNTQRMILVEFAY